MILKDSFIVEAPLAAVWALLQDVPRISVCIPGVRSFEEVGPDSYKGLLQVKIGPIRSSFEGQVTFIERVPLARLVAEVDGRDKVSASQVKATFTGLLSAVESGTQLDYEMDIALRGKLAQFGLVVVRATAKKMTSEFSKCFTDVLAESNASNQE